jgi:predicted phosphodiesterase
MGGVISDRHDNILNILKSVKYSNEKQASFLIHASDNVSPKLMNHSLAEN